MILRTLAGNGANEPADVRAAVDACGKRLGPGLDDLADREHVAVRCGRDLFGRR
jgi:hypothetical protein